MIPAPTRSDPLPSAQRLQELIRQLMAVMNQRSAGDTLAIMNKAHLTLPQMVAMHILEVSGPQSISAIATRLGLSAAATSHLVDRLVRARFVVRTEEAADRRQKRIEIAASGHKLLAQIHESRGREMTRVMSRLSPRVRKDMEHLMLAMIEELSRENGTQISNETSV